MTVYASTAKSCWDQDDSFYMKLVEEKAHIAMKELSQLLQRSYRTMFNNKPTESMTSLFTLSIILINLCVKIVGLSRS